MLAQTEQLEALLQPDINSHQKVITQGKAFGNNKKRIKGKDLGKGSRRSIGDFIRYRREEISNEIANGMPIWTASPKSLLAKGEKRG